MSFRRVLLVWWSCTILLALPGFGAGAVTGSVKDAGGKTLNGVFVSAERDGATFTTTVYTDDAGRYQTAMPQTQGRNPASIIPRATSRNETGSITPQWRWSRSAT